MSMLLAPGTPARSKRTIGSVRSSVRTCPEPGRPSLFEGSSLAMGSCSDSAVAVGVEDTILDQGLADDQIVLREGRECRGRPGAPRRDVKEDRSGLASVAAVAGSQGELPAHVL